MSSQLDKLRAKAASSFSTITEEMAKSNSSSGSNDDPRFWHYTPDKSGNAAADIRFLINLDGDELPWVKLFRHEFKGPTGKWYIENCRSTIGEDDPVAESNSVLWNQVKTDEAKEVARQRKRKLSYISKIYVVRDPGNPDNEGKVFYFRYGKKIFEMIMEKAKPQFVDDDTEIASAWDMWDDGATFKLRSTKVEGQTNYDKSSWYKKGPLNADIDKVVKMMEELPPLSSFVALDQFKSYEELKRKFVSVVGNSDNVRFGLEGSVAQTSLPPAKSAPEKPTIAPLMEKEERGAAPSKFDDPDEEGSIEDYFAKLETKS